MATQAKEVGTEWEKLSEGTMCVLQVQEGEILVYVGTDQPDSDDTVSSYIIDGVFTYTGNENVYVKGRGVSKIVYDEVQQTGTN